MADIRARAAAAEATDAQQDFPDVFQIYGPDEAPLTASQAAESERELTAIGLARQSGLASGETEEMRRRALLLRQAAQAHAEVEQAIEQRSRPER